MVVIMQICSTTLLRDTQVVSETYSAVEKEK